MSAILLNDDIVHYEVLGRGKPLIFLHGWVGSWRYWMPSMQAASISYRTYALDLWGFGDTARNPMYYTLEQQTALLDQFLQEMGIMKIAIVGHGLGALIGVLYAIRNPRFVDRVMAVGLPTQAQSLNGRLSNIQPTEMADWLLGKSLGGDAARIEALKADPGAIQLSLAHLQALDMSKVLSALTTPCLMVYGQNDPLIDRVPGREFTLPEYIHQIVLENCGHFPMLDEDARFHRLMVDFLALTSGESPRSLQLKEEWKRRVR